MKRSAEFNLRLYPWYVGIFHAYFWLPIYFLFFNSKLDLADVLMLESIYFFCVVIMEVPSGWFSDTFGRKRTLLAASISLAFAYLLFIFAQNFYTFAIAQAFLAAGIAFNSGTDTSFLLESSQAANKEQEYPAREAQATKFNFLGTAAAGILGGIAAWLDYRGAYLLSFLGAIAMIWITYSFTEPKTNKLKEDQKLNFFNQIIACISLLRNMRLVWLFGFAVFLTIINHIPYEFYQPYLKTLAQQFEVVKATPIATSIHLTLTMLIASWFASRSIAIRNRIGLSITLFSAAGLQIAMMAIMHFFINIPAAIATLLRSCPRALSSAPLNAAIAPNVPTTQRATFLSLMSLNGRLGFALTLILFAAKAGDESWQTKSHMLKIGMWIGLSLLAFFIFTSLLISKNANRLVGKS